MKFSVTKLDINFGFINIFGNRWQQNDVTVANMLLPRISAN